MANGDERWALMVQPNTLPCGCYVGIWYGVTPPPRCARHSLDWINSGAHPWPGEPSPIEQPREDWDEMLRRIGRAHSGLPIEDIVEQIEGAMLVAARQAKVSGDIAAHDAWQLALECLEPLRAAIERARKAGEG